jgi:hypothetical protein
MKKNSKKHSKAGQRVAVCICFSLNITALGAGFNPSHLVVGTIEPLIRATEAEAANMNTVGHQPRWVSASGIEQAALRAVVIVRSGLRGIREYMNGGFRRDTDGSPESQNYIVSVLHSVMNIAYDLGETEISQEVQPYLDPASVWFRKSARVRGHNPIIDVQKHNRIFNYWEWMKGLKGVLAAAAGRWPLHNRYRQTLSPIPITPWASWPTL